MKPILNMTEMTGMIELLRSGIMLLVTFIAAVCVFPLLDKKTQGQFIEYVAMPMINLLLIFGFGFLIGVILSKL